MAAVVPAVACIGPNQVAADVAAFLNADRIPEPRSNDEDWMYV